MLERVHSTPSHAIEYLGNPVEDGAVVRGEVQLEAPPNDLHQQSGVEGKVVQNKTPPAEVEADMLPSTCIQTHT